MDDYQVRLSLFRARKSKTQRVEAVSAEQEQTLESKELTDMTVADLKRYAAENGIDLGTVTKKADILAAILAHVSEENGPETNESSPNENGDDDQRGEEGGDTEEADENQGEGGDGDGAEE